MTALTIPRGFRVTPEQFDQLAFSNTEVRLELTAEGELIVMPPTGGTAGKRNARLTTQLTAWADRDGSGIAFDSSTEFILPNGARRSPDAAWIRLERWDALNPEQQDGFPPIAPDFIIELVSPSDLKNQRYEDLQQKMQEYLDNGVRLGWLIELPTLPESNSGRNAAVHSAPKQKTVEIYRLGQAVEITPTPKTLSGESVLPGFVLDLEPIWS